MKKKNPKNFFRRAALNSSNDSPYDKGSKSNTKVPKTSSGFHYGSVLFSKRALKGTKKEIHPGGIWKYSKKDDMYSQLEEGNFRVSRDIKPYMCKRTKKMMRGAKTFWRFNDYKKYVDYLAILDDCEKTFYEQAASNPNDQIKLFLDIDMSRKEEQYKDVSTGKIQCFLTKVMSYLSVFLTMTMVWNIYTSIDPSGMKESYHLVASYVVMQDKNKLKKLITHTKYHFETVLKDPLFGTIDDGVYTKHRAIRLLDNTKIGQCRKKIYKCTIKTCPVSNGSSAGITTGTSKKLDDYKHNSWSDSLVHHFTPDTVTLVDTSSLKLTAKPNVVRVATRKRKQTQITLGGNDSSKVRKIDTLTVIIEKHTDRFIQEFLEKNGFEIRNQPNKHLINLNSIHSSSCPACKRLHDSENGYLIINYSIGEIYFTCFRDTSVKVLLAKFKEPTKKEIQHCTKAILPIALYYKEYQTSDWNAYIDNGSRLDNGKLKLSSIMEMKETQQLKKRCTLISAGLELGKTYQCIGRVKALLKEKPTARVLWLSPRISYSIGLHERVTEQGLKFENYHKVKGKTSTKQLLISSLESIHKYATDIDNSLTAPDLIVCDEITSCLMQLTSRETMGVNLLKNLIIFQKLCTLEKTELLFSDGFLLPGTLKTLKDMGIDYDLIINPCVPDRGMAYFINNYNDFSSRIYNDVNTGGKNIYHHSASRTKLENLEKTIKVPLSKNGKVSKFYVGGDGGKFSLNDFTGNLLGVTSTITVGIDYSGDLFDRSYLYCSAFGSVIRDSIQGILRVRNLKDKEVYVNVMKMFNNIGIYKNISEVEDFQRYKSEYYKTLMEMNGVEKTFTTVPKWVTTNMNYSMLEKNLSQCYPLEITLQYMKLLGLKVQFLQESPDEKRLRINIKKNNVKYDDILDITRISYQEENELEQSVRDNSATQEERLLMEKIKFHRYVNVIDNDDINGSNSHKELFEKVWLKNKSYFFNRLMIEKGICRKEMIEREIQFSKIESYSSMSPLCYDQMKNLLFHFKIKEINDEGEISRDTLRDLYDSKMFATLLKVFGKKKSLKKITSDEKPKETQKLLNSILKRYLMKMKVGKQRHVRVNYTRTDVSNYKLISVFNIENLIK